MKNIKRKGIEYDRNGQAFAVSERGDNIYTKDIQMLALSNNCMGRGATVHWNVIAHDYDGVVHFLGRGTIDELSPLVKGIEQDQQNRLKAKEEEESFREAWQQSLNGESHPISELRDGIEGVE